jgi:cytochrome c biogenesis protein CcdA/thiol-disulfide isomerase/thioredoxin
MLFGPDDFAAVRTHPARTRQRIPDMFTLALIGFVGGLITAVSPCILPVLPVIFFSGAHSAPGESARLAESDGGVAVEERRSLSDTSRPYRVIAGLVLSFSLVTLLGSALLSLLHLPQDAIRWVALIALVAIGVGLIFPRFEQLLERPFSRIPQRQIGPRRDGFGLGLALGVLYVPCAGPVLAAIVVAGATARIGVGVVMLTVAFAVGTAVPLLFFALAGQRVAQRVNAFRRCQREIRVAAGIVTILLAVALVFNVPAMLQRAIPDYTNSLQEKVGGGEQIRQKLDMGGIVTDQNRQLSNCSNGGTQLENCGPAPDLKGITGWLNTPGNKPVDVHSLRGKVVLVDFWAYSCINCQRAIPHVEGWYRTYKDSGRGFEVIGVHTPEYAFEKVTGNVAKGAADLGITYPIALDNGYSTWTNYRNRYWPAEYLIDANGIVRHIKFGEGDYNVTEQLIRRLLSDANPGVKLPAALDAPDLTPKQKTTPETYFGVGKVVNYAGGGTYDEGSATFTYPPSLPPDSFALSGRWSLDYQGATAQGDDSSIELNYHAKDVYLVAGGTGTLTVIRDGKSTTLPISGPPTSHQIVSGERMAAGTLEVRLTQGLEVYSFTYG